MPRRRETGTSESRSEQQRPRLSQTAPGTFTGPCPAAVTAPCRCSLARRDSSCDLRRGPGPALGGQSRARTPSHRRIVLACRRRVRTGTSVCADSALRLVTRHITSLRVTSRRTRNRQRRTLACLRVGTDAALAPGLDCAWHGHWPVPGCRHGGVPLQPCPPGPAGDSA